MLRTLVIYLVLMLCASSDLKTKVRRRMRASPESIQSGQASLKFVNIINKHLVIKRFDNQKDFDNEVSVLSKLKHCSHVLQPAFTIPELREISFKRIQEGDLFHFKSINKLSLTDILDISRQIISAVDSIHQAGYLHLDIKPENILFDGNKIWLIDFGLARPINETARGIGTRRGMAPEMLFPSFYWMPITAATDWWSVGVTLFHLYARYFELAADHHFKYFPYKVQETDDHDMILEWTSDPPALSPLILDLLFGRYGLLSYDYRDRLHNAATLLAHPLFVNTR